MKREPLWPLGFTFLDGRHVVFINKHNDDAHVYGLGKDFPNLEIVEVMTEQEVWDSVLGSRGPKFTVDVLGKVTESPAEPPPGRSLEAAQ